jgi:hypothetical protein
MDPDLVDAYSEKKRAVERALDRGGLPYSTSASGERLVDPRGAATWARLRFGHFIIPERAFADDKPLDVRRETTYLAIVAGLLKSTTDGEGVPWTVRTCAQACCLSEGTISGVLKMAKELDLLSPDFMVVRQRHGAVDVEDIVTKAKPIK